MALYESKNGVGTKLATIPYIKYLTAVNYNNGGTVTLNNYTIPENGSYLIIVASGGDATKALENYEGITTFTLNGNHQDYKRLLSSIPRQYLNDYSGIIIDACILQAEQGDVLYISTSGANSNTSGQAGYGSTTSIIVYEFIFNNYLHRNLKTLAFAPTYINTNPDDYIINTNDSNFKGRSYIAFVFIRSGNTDNFYNDITISNTDKVDTLTEQMTDLYNPSAWAVRSKCVYPQKYNEEIVTIKQKNLSRVTQLIVIGV